MQKRLCLVIASCLLSANAMAGDWTGWYVGGQVGHGSGNSDAEVSLGGQWGIEPQALQDHVSSTWSTELEPRGTTYGVQFSYNHQFDSNFVLGGELDYSQHDMDDDRVTGMTPAPGFGTLSYNFGNAGSPGASPQPSSAAASAEPTIDQTAVDRSADRAG